MQAPESLRGEPHSSKAYGTATSSGEHLLHSSVADPEILLSMKCPAIILIALAC